ncbi:hypothetical protein VP01_1847g3 [Puccinia sorghi]|uniref:Uncharacterized protein n=1 Tax=Puccinia sorghi TaxID=27349 RepID=A0A0L6VFJ7_9BASI|nr:hypothetical protein VP01_1847g3 [Puccinia sorghi]
MLKDENNKQARDFVETSGNAGLFSGLVEYGILESLWEELLDIKECCGICCW